MTQMQKERWLAMLESHPSARFRAEVQAYGKAGSEVRAAKKDSTVELYIYGVIGANYWDEGVSASDVTKALKDAGEFDRISLRINSPGGSVFEGAAIYTQIKAAGKPVSVRVDGLAASAAFTIAMTGDTIEIGEAASMMLHNAWGVAIGEAKDMRAEADLLDKISGQMGGIYARRSGLSVDDVQQMMDAETWLTAQEAVSKGFAHTVLESEAAQARTPSAPHQQSATKADPACTCACDECMAGDCDECSDPNCDCDGCTCDQIDASASIELNERRLRAIELTL